MIDSRRCPIINSASMLFRVMRQAYDARSAIVHGGSPPQDTRLPDNQSASLPTFIDAIEEVVRLGLRKALSYCKQGTKTKLKTHRRQTLRPGVGPI